jgi:DinB superfamily
MEETPEQYVRRILGYLDAKDPLAILEATPAALSRLVGALDETRLRARPSSQRWSMAEIVAHLAEVELVVGYRVRTILATNGAAIQAFDQDEWAKRYAHTPVALSLEMHRGLRAVNLSLYRSLTSEEWQRYGLHSERGKETIDHIVKLAAGHDLNHLRQMSA